MPFLFIQLRALDVIDILLVAILLYQLYNLVKGTIAIRIFIGLLALIIVWKITDVFEMELVSTILGQFLGIGAIALVIIFQPELRNLLLKLGTTRFLGERANRFSFFRKSGSDSDGKLDNAELATALKNMSHSKTGALIIIEGDNDLGKIVDTGTRLNAQLSAPLIESIFSKESPLHDGAVVIRENMLVAAACILPVSDRSTIPSKFGLRHRAAVGITEPNDCIAIVVSEETGHIHRIRKGNLKKIERLDNLFL